MYTVKSASLAGDVLEGNRSVAYWVMARHASRRPVAASSRSLGGGEPVRLLASIFCVLVLCLCLSGGAWGDSVAIQNASFETAAPLLSPCAGPETCLYNFGSIPGWSITGSTGSFQPSSTYFSLPLPDGNILAFSNGGSISQTLTGISLLANSTYTLSVDVGRRFDVLAANYSISLYDGSTALCTTGGSNGSIAQGSFIDATLSCTTGASVPSGFLGIVLSGDGRQVDFDNVRLDVVSTVSTPEPSVLVLMLATLGVVGLFFVRSRRNHHLQVASS